MSTPSDEPEDALPPCDHCDKDGALWCDKCNVVFCNDCSGRHDGHPTGSIGTCNDAYDYDDDTGADGAKGVITEDVTEEQAYHIVEMLEMNAHLSCRKLLKPHVVDAGRKMLRARQLPEAVSQAQFGPDGSLQLTDEQLASLALQSLIVLDGFIPGELVAAARAQTLELLAEGQLTEYKNPKDIGRDDTVRTDLRMFFDEAAAADVSGPLATVVGRLQDLGRVLRDVAQLEADAHEYQLAFYGSKGEHYKKHRDAFPNDGTRRLTGQVGRRVTCTLYLNEAYEEAHGGKIRVYVPNVACTEETPLDVAPVGGRAVLFLSGAMDHEVLPSFAPRCAFAAWYS